MDRLDVWLPSNLFRNLFETMSNTKPPEHLVPNLVTQFEGSSLLKQAEYDPFMKTLTLHFHDETKLYEYIDVTQEVFDELSKAESAGKFFHRNIRGKFEFLKQPLNSTPIEPAEEEKEKE